MPNQPEPIRKSLNWVASITWVLFGSRCQKPNLDDMHIDHCPVLSSHFQKISLRSML